MKFVMLVNGSIGNFEKMIKMAEPYNSIFIDTEHCDEEHEHHYLLKNVHDFAMSDATIMLARFSGRESIVDALGGECKEMIVSLSYNKNSKYYTECPTDTFLELINIFNKETK